MSDSSYITVRFANALNIPGDSQQFLFHILEANSSTSSIIVSISGTLISILQIGSEGFDLPAIAAKAIEYWLLNDCPIEVYDHSKNILHIQTTWYPGFPNTIELQKDYTEFQVQKPKRKLGFRTT